MGISCVQRNKVPPALESVPEDWQPFQQLSFHSFAFFGVQIPTPDLRGGHDLALFMGCVSSSERVNNEEKTECGEQENHKNKACIDDGHVNKEGELIAQVSVDCEPAVKMKIPCRKNRWGLATMRLLTGSKRSARNLSSLNEFDHNDTWLLAGDLVDQLGCCSPGTTESPDITSVHSSFRFSFGSQLDLEAACNNNNNNNPVGCRPTVLLVNLEKGLETPDCIDDIMASTNKSDVQWARIQSLERHILPAVDGLTRFDYEEIRLATSDFSQDKVLGRGAHSCVYRGRMRFGKPIAVKRLDCDDKESDKAFCRELHIASSLKNRHVVPLLGYCIDRLGLFLVYKFISGGSLEYHLHEKRTKGKGSLSWSARFRVAVGIAKSVDYLHHGTQKCVLHRDIKPSNILLSSRKTAKLCDFGLATWTLGASVPFLCKSVKGTFGYLAPEYFQHGKVSEKTDIYAFGVVLLELLTGRKAIDTERPGVENLVLWARPLLYRGMAEELVDPQLRSSCNAKQVTRMMRAAAVCLHPMESWRPCMSHILKILRGEEDTRLIQHARLTLLDDMNGESEKNMKALQGHLALAMVGMDLDLDFANNNNDEDNNNSSH